jgi:phosphopantothenoylcysteine decarboxylase/phosphopantothenate--cysteine ligase
MSILASKTLLLGVTGSIAAYKAVDLASKLSQAGADVNVVLTAAAEKFVTPLSFQSVTDRRAFVDADLWGGQAHILHVDLGQRSDLMIVAPCTANSLAKLAHGLADNLLTITALAARCPLLVAPAMDFGMYEQPATQENLQRLRAHGVMVIGPAEGRLASGLVGQGRLAEVAELIGAIRLNLGKKGRLAGKKLVITAGGTQEPIDPVRVIANRSSGKQGYALAQAAVDAGADVILISCPTALSSPFGVHLVPVHTAEEIKTAVLEQARCADGLVMAAAVADFRPRQIARNKLKKLDGIPQLELEPAPDILASLAEMKSERPRRIIGFAAESQDLIPNALAKLKSKHLDMIAANDISAEDAGFGVDTNRVTLLYPDGRSESLPLLEKEKVAEMIIERLAVMLESS